VTSEIGTLRRVVVHTPGQEVRRMTPALRHDLLFDDILYLDLARHEHEAFKRLISVIVPPDDILDSADMLRDVLQDEQTRRDLVVRYVHSKHHRAGGNNRTPLWFDLFSPNVLNEVHNGNSAFRIPHSTLEGGDVLVIRPDLLLVGVSERTSAEAVDLLARG